jgi:hypothetical protein
MQSNKSGVIGNAVSLDKDYALSGAKEIVVNRHLKEKYDSDNLTNTVEHKLIKLISYLGGVKLARVAEVGSKLDCHDKIDILIETDNDCVLGFQVKHGFKNAESFSTKYNIGVIWIEPNYNPLVLLLQLSKFLKLDIKDEVKQLYTLVKLHRNKLLPSKIVNLSKYQLDILTTLKLIQIRGRDIQF